MALSTNNIHNEIVGYNKIAKLSHGIDVKEDDESWNVISIPKV